jgi:hypothetical protein
VCSWRLYRHWRSLRERQVGQDIGLGGAELGGNAREVRVRARRARAPPRRWLPRLTLAALVASALVPAFAVPGGAGGLPPPPPKQTVATGAGGGRGIRTPGPLAGPAVFKTAPINRSGIPPRRIRISRPDPAALGSRAGRPGDQAIGHLAEPADVRLDEDRDVGGGGGQDHALVVDGQRREQHQRDRPQRGR